MDEDNIRFNFQVMPERLVKGASSSLISAITSCTAAITASMERHNTILFRIDQNLSTLAERRPTAMQQHNHLSHTDGTWGICPK